MQRHRHLLRHFLGTLAYRTQRAVRGAPPGFWDLSAGEGSRTPTEILRHMTHVVSFARNLFMGGSSAKVPEPLPSPGEELERFHEVLEELGGLIESGAKSVRYSHEEILQGPLADAMTHVGQLAFIRRLAGSPLPRESFIDADVDGSRLGMEQADLPAPRRR